MPDLIDMKLPPKSKKELKEFMEPPQEEWPYGLRLCLEKEQIDKIPIVADMKMGDRVSVQAEGSITSMSMSERKGKEDYHTVEIQIEKIAIEPTEKKKPEEMTSHEYREFRMKKK